ncbi:hypothetical protein GZL_02028 [Streptomyces sp. 769]|nr:hypothetical protein GZL_02028 [Streptomyces sp. 769]
MQRRGATARAGAVIGPAAFAMPSSTSAPPSGTARGASGGPRTARAAHRPQR